jgi:ParB-like chromosome segregation protein Spo0J
MITEKRELKNVPLADLIPYARNPRKNDPAVQRVAASLKEYGLVKNSIVVDEDMVLITGHTTTKAMQALKWATAPEVTQVFGLTEAQKKAYRIADNKLGELAAWDDELLALELDDLKVLDFDLDLTGFDDKELGKILDAGKEASEDDYEPPVEIETSIQRGDLFRLGRHRLLCGDSTARRMWGG